jgi:hypothetical protein
LTIVDVDCLADQSRLPTPTCRLRLFVVADGAHVDRSELPGNPDEWFNPHCRLLAVVDFENISTEPDILFIVGSDDVRNDQRFLQVASWDGKAFDYYAVCMNMIGSFNPLLKSHRSKTSMAIRAKEHGHSKPTPTMPSRTGHHTICHTSVHSTGM